MVLLIYRQRLRVDWHEKQKLFEDHSLRGPHFSVNLTSRKLSMLFLKIQKKIPSRLWLGEEKVTIANYAQSVLYTKGLLSKGKDFARASSQLEKNIPPILVSLCSLPHLREQTVLRS